MLGLAPVTTAAIATEDATDPTKFGPGYPRIAELSEATQTRIAYALERLARSIRAGEVTAHGFEVHSEFRPGNFLEHSLALRFELVERK